MQGAVVLDVVLGLGVDSWLNHLTLGTPSRFSKLSVLQRKVVGSLDCHQKALRVFARVKPTELVILVHLLIRFEQLVKVARARVVI